jgi:Leucine-rich repeat (LRR) protein
MKKKLLLFESKKLTMLLVTVMCVYSVYAQKFEDKSYLKKNQPVSNAHRTQFIPDSRYGAVVSQYNLTEALKNPDMYKSARFYAAGLKAFPEELFLFKNLEEIDLSSNEITSLPAKLNEFKYLRELHVNRNKITSLGAEIVSCPLLQVLQIQENPLQTITSDIGKMKTLQEITIGEIAAGCVIPAELWTLTDLKKIKITNANIAEIPAGIANFHQLDVLCLTNNAITKIPDEVYSLKTLTYLNLGHNNIKTISPSVAKLENLNYLGVFYNPVATLPWELSGLKKLSFISCWKTGVSQKEINAWKAKMPDTIIHNTETDLH